SSHPVHTLSAFLLEIAHRLRLGACGNDAHWPWPQPLDEAFSRLLDQIEVGARVPAGVDHEEDRVVGGPDREDLPGRARLLDHEVVGADVHHGLAAGIQHRDQREAARPGLRVGWGLILGRNRCGGKRRGEGQREPNHPAGHYRTPCSAENWHGHGPKSGTAAVFIPDFGSHVAQIRSPVKAKVIDIYSWRYDHLSASDICLPARMPCRTETDTLIRLDAGRTVSGVARRNTAVQLSEEEDTQ